MCFLAGMKGYPLPSQRDLPALAGSSLVANDEPDPRVRPFGTARFRDWLFELIGDHSVDTYTAAGLQAFIYLLTPLGRFTSRRLGLLVHLQGNDFREKYPGVWVAQTAGIKLMGDVTWRRIPIKRPARPSSSCTTSCARSASPNGRRASETDSSFRNSSAFPIRARAPAST